VKDKDELPASLVRENTFMALAAIVQLLFLPVFIYNCSKTARDRRYCRPVQMRFINYLEGDSCATILYNALWQYGIPTHLSSLQYAMEEGQILMVCEFYVPATQAFMADVLLWQWSNNQTGLSFRNESPLQYQHGIPSHKYRDKLYKPVGVHAKPKSIDMLVGNLLFGHMLQKSEVSFSKKEGEVKYKTDEIPDLPQSKKTVKKQKQSGRKSAKLGKTYS
jgi:hypothetical protein